MAGRDRFGLVLVGLCTLIAACSGADSGSEAASDPTTTVTAVAEAGYPKTIAHVFGSTTLEEPPERVFSVSYRHHDLMYQLGVAPVGVREWWGEYEYATWPWAEEARADVGAEPVVMTGEMNLEMVSAAEPDLILAIYSGITEEEYDLLSQIAPVIASSADHYEWGTPWRLEVETVGEALGKSDEAARIVAETDERIVEARSSHPEFEGATIALADYANGTFSTYGSSDASHQFLSELGFVIPAEFDELTPTPHAAVEIAAERAEMLDLDVVVWYPYAWDEIESHPMYETLDLSKEQRSVWLDDPVLEGAFSFQTPLSMGYTLDHLVPMLESAIDGDPGTPVGQ